MMPNYEYSMIRYRADQDLNFKGEIGTNEAGGVKIELAKSSGDPSNGTKAGSGQKKGEEES